MDEIPLMKVVEVIQEELHVPRLFGQNQVALLYLCRLIWCALLELFPVAGCVGSRDPCPSTPTQRAVAKIPQAIGLRQR
jgi:hypothetical protein